jgi:trimeric autotransporter adhesin
MNTRYVRPARSIAGLIVLALGLACGSGGDNSPTGGGGLSKIALTPSADTLQIGDTVTIVAQPQTGNGSPVSGVTLFWSSSAEGVATVNQSGHVTAVDSGTALIAASANGISAAATIVVTHKNVASITISPPSSNLFINGSVQLAATLKDSSGNILTGRTVTWSSSNTAAATVDQSGFVLAVAVGSTTISAKSGGATGTASITVSNVPVASVTIAPASPTVIVGQTTQLTATVKDAGGNVLTGRPVTWTSATTGVATIAATTGLATGVAVGTSSITAASGGVTSPAVTLTVQNPPANNVAISPSVANLLVGGTVQLTATVTDANGNPITGATVTYTSGNTGVATVTTAGFVTGVAPGTAVITGKSGVASGAAAINVTLVPVKTVTVAPALDTVTSGGTVQLTATTLDSAGNVLTGRPVTWTSGNTADATVNTTGLVTTSSSTSITTSRSVTIFATSGSAQGVSTTVVRPVGIQSVTVTPAADTVAQGATKQLTATVIDSLGRTVTRTISWTSANSSIASVSGSGLVTGGADTGTTTITATASGVSGTNTTSVTQTPTTGVTVTLTPANDTLLNGATGQAQAVTTPANRPVTWSSSNTSVATIDANSGVITGVGVGSATITGTSGSASGSAVLTVVQTPTTGVSVTLAPANDSLVVGGSGQASATTTPPLRPVAWTSSVTTVATINAISGAITAIGVGSTTITGTSGSATGSAVLTVTAAVPASITLVPAPSTVSAGNPVSFVVQSGGQTVTGLTINWNVSPTLGGTASGSTTTGAFAYTPTSTGAATVTASIPNGGPSATSALTVVSQDTIAPDTGTVSILNANSITLTVTVRTAAGLPSAGQTVNWVQASASGSTALVQFTSATTVPTDVNGNATVTLAAPPVASLPTIGGVIITADTPDGKNPTATITVSP